MSEKPNMRGNPKTQSSKPDPAPAPSPSPASTPSLATRIQSSATALAKSTLQPGSDLNNTLTSNNKSGPSASASIPTPSDNAPQLGSRSGSSASTGPRESFRTSNSTIPVPDGDFQQFQEEPRLDSEILGDDYTDGVEQENGKGKGKARLESAWQDPNQMNGQSAPAPESAFASELQIHQNNLQTPEDGSAVLALLSTSFEEDPSTIPDTELDPAPLPLSAREREALDSYRISSSGPRLTSSSLVPDIDTFLSQGYNEGLGSGMTGSALRDEVLAQLPGAGDWIGVQERYHDEVWGFLEPVLEAARVEIERGREGVEMGVEMGRGRLLGG
ncbi:hypothetical protein N7541_001034 [Penicillium brevicompactum]|uniref:Uncharacterized protein n=1 Tax=Penicillium brevicompactum TaxID=5074 RepID=A0A9W9S065_PENBR|nr:hypothetical protein N7541_001034 [Penicillium brevicompactum]